MPFYCNLMPMHFLFYPIVLIIAQCMPTGMSPCLDHTIYNQHQCFQNNRTRTMLWEIYLHFTVVISAQFGYMFKHCTHKSTNCNRICLCIVWSEAWWFSSITTWKECYLSHQLQIHWCVWTDWSVHLLRLIHWDETYVYWNSVECPSILQTMTLNSFTTEKKQNDTHTLVLWYLLHWKVFL